MKISFMWIGKSKDKSYDDIIDKYLDKIKHYSSVDLKVLRQSKVNYKNPETLKQYEARDILKQLKHHDFLVLLEERGRKLSSRGLADWIQHKQNISIGHVVFLIAGAYGAHEDLKQRADYILSLSDMTYTHDMARMIITEQVYRAFTILRGESYHND